MELDATFRKALKLLHTRTEEAGLQLRQMLDDARLQKRINTVKENKVSIKMESETGKLSIKKTSAKEVNEVLPVTSSKHSQEDGRKKETEKRHLEKTKHDAIEFMHDLLHEPKRIKAENVQQYSYAPLSPELPKADVIFSLKTEEDSENSDGNADDFAMEMGLACVICKQIDVTQGNQLIECQECHSLYHQECHRPPATDHDVNDPRRVWYCAKCTKNMKKLATKTQKTSKNTTASVSKESPSQIRSIKSESSLQAVLLPFKRTELKAPVNQGNSLSSANKPIGLAGLAANLSGRATTAPPPPPPPPPPPSSSSSSSSSASSSPSSSSSTGSTLRTGSSKPNACCKTKAFGPYSTLTTHVSSKSSPQVIAQSSLKTLPSNTASPTKMNSINSYASQSGTSGSISIAPKNNSSPSPISKPNNCALSSLISVPCNRVGSSGNGNSCGMAAGGAKPASSSSLMSADKRLQIMKKKAAKMQEKRRLSSK